jgi:hypothetical protein
VAFASRTARDRVEDASVVRPRRSGQSRMAPRNGRSPRHRLHRSPPIVRDRRRTDPAETRSGPPSEPQSSSSSACGPNSVAAAGPRHTPLGPRVEDTPSQRASSVDEEWSAFRRGGVCVGPTRRGDPPRGPQVPRGPLRPVRGPGIRPRGRTTAAVFRESEHQAADKDAGGVRSRLHGPEQGISLATTDATHA